MSNGYQPTALPSRGARAIAFGAIVLAGLCGGIIGFAFVEVQCNGDCAFWAGVGALVGALSCALGTAVVAILAMRALAEAPSATAPAAPPPRRPGPSRSQ